jgi:hypothetical protein
MTYYAFIQNNKINGCGQCPCTSETIFSFEITEEVYNNIDHYIWDGSDVVLDPDYDEKQAQKEAERIAQLHLTRGDVFRALLMARQVTRAQIRGLIEQMPEETPEQMIAKEYALIDFDESLDFYRGVQLIDTLGQQLGISSEAMTQFFETNDWHYLIPDTRTQGEE